MTSRAMHETQQSGAGAWELEARRSVRLAPADGALRLRVMSGAVWITLDGTLEQPAVDHWLLPGQEFVLPHAVGAVMEGWPVARVEAVACTAEVPVAPTGHRQSPDPSLPPRSPKAASSALALTLEPVEPVESVKAANAIERDSAMPLGSPSLDRSRLRAFGG